MSSQGRGVMLGGGVRAQIRTGDRAGRTDRDDRKPNAEEAEENPEGRAANSVEQTDDSGALLAGAFEENRAEGCDNRVNHKSQDRSGDNRDEEIGGAQERTHKREQHASAEKRDRICRTQGKEPDDLSDSSALPAADDFEENQDEGKRNKDHLPE